WQYGSLPGDPGGPAPQGPPPGQQKSALPVLLVVVGIVVGLLLIATVAVVAVVTLSKKPEDAVKGYLEAVQAGNAAEALSYAEEPPSDTTLLTDEVLQKSNELGGITDIEIRSSSDSVVRASYRVGDQTALTSYEVTQTDDGWKLKTVAFRLGLRSVTKNAALVVNGVEAPDTEGAQVFPGSYELGTGSEWYEWTTTEIVVPGGEGSVVPGMVKLTDEGEKAARDAIESWLDDCLAKKELKPKGCPFQLSRVNGTPDTSTITWSIPGKSPAESWRASRVDDVSRVSGPVMYRVHLTFKYERGGDTHTYDQSAMFAQSLVVDLTKDPITVGFQKR